MTQKNDGGTCGQAALTRFGGAPVGRVDGPGVVDAGDALTVGLFVEP